MRRWLSLGGKLEVKFAVTVLGPALTLKTRLVGEGRVRAMNGSDVKIKADTICVHGDGPQAVAFARRLARELRQLGVEFRAPHLPERVSP